MQSARRFALAPLVVLGLLMLLLACEKKPDSPDAPGALIMDRHEYERWEIALVEMRIEKNDDFAAAATSPLPADRLTDFEGLNYYLPAPELRFEVPFTAAAGTDTVKLTKRKGQVVPYVARGTLAFRHADKVHELTVFGPAAPDGEDYLWLPFFDTTSRTETYPGGRYLDVTVNSEGLVDLDFNYAYNPLCDYNTERYNCTLPPLSNTLYFAAEAGEKRFSADHEHHGSTGGHRPVVRLRAVGPAAGVRLAVRVPGARGQLHHPGAGAGPRPDHGL